MLGTTNSYAASTLNPKSFRILNLSFKLQVRLGPAPSDRASLREPEGDYPLIFFPRIVLFGLVKPGVLKEQEISQMKRMAEPREHLHLRGTGSALTTIRLEGGNLRSDDDSLERRNKSTKSEKKV